MSYPELYSDERVVLQAQNVKVKSVVFEVVLTTRRLVLIDSKKGSIPPQEINLATLKDVEGGENAIRDPTITISIITISGNTRQMVLTFSKTSGGERRREADEWVRALRQNITSTVYHPVGQVPAPKETEPAVREPVVQTPVAQPPSHPPQRIEITNTPPPKKRIEIARPVKKIMEPVPAMPVPVETTSLPTGSFCNRCGNRVPPDSAFCNHCGTPVVQDTGVAGLPTDYDTISFEPTPAAPPVAPMPPAVPQVQVTPSPVYPTIADKKDRPIEEVIHSIEPLIEDSVPRTAPAPLVPARQPHFPSSTDMAQTAGAPDQAETPVPGDQPAGGVQWPVLKTTGFSDVAAPSPAPLPTAAPSATVPPVPAAPKRGYGKWIAGIAILLVVVIAGAFVFMHFQNPAPATVVTPTPTGTVVETTAIPTTPAPVRTTEVPAATTPPRQVSTPAILTPTTGVWVKVTYSGKYTGSVGTPNYQRDISDTGDHFYQISTSQGPVAVSVQKYEGSSETLSVDVYKDGVLVSHESTSAPKGVVEYQADLTTATPTETPAPAAPVASVTT